MTPHAIDELPHATITFRVTMSNRLRLRVRLGCLLLRAAVIVLGWRFRLEVMR